MPAVATRADAIRPRSGGIEIRSLTPIGTIPGVCVEQVAGRNGRGAATLRSRNTVELSWKAPGSTSFGAWVAAPMDGSYLLEDGDDHDKFARVTVAAAHLTQGSAEHRVLLEDVYNNAVAGADITATEAAQTLAQYWNFDLVNDSAETVRDLRVWNAPFVPSSFAISDDGIIYLVISNETDALRLGDLAPGASATVYVLRLVGIPITPLVAAPLEFFGLDYSFQG